MKKTISIRELNILRIQGKDITKTRKQIRQPGLILPLLPVIYGLQIERNCMMDYSSLITFINEKEPEMFRLLEKMVLIQSGSYNKNGIDSVVKLIDSSFEGNNVKTRVIEQKTFGNHIIVRSDCDKSDSGQILITGHMDTVFPEDTRFNWYKEDEKNVYGPGVIDMKGGLVVGIFAIKALDYAGLLTSIPITFIFNSDEEIGSKTSKKLIKKEAEKSSFAFVLECGGDNGEIVTGRKGNITGKLHIKGKAGHAAFAGKDKASAILEMARKIIAIEAMNDHERGITANVGTVKGGIGSNTIAEHAVAGVDFRFVKENDNRTIKKKIEEITGSTTVPETKAQFEISSARPPMEETKKIKSLYKAIEKTGNNIGVPVKPQFRQGVSDANFIAMEGIPVIDGLGPIGGKDHSDKEFMIKKTLAQRASLFACSLTECWELFVKGKLF